MVLVLALPNDGTAELYDLYSFHMIPRMAVDRHDRQLRILVRTSFRKFPTSEAFRRLSAFADSNR